MKLKVTVPDGTTLEQAEDWLFYQLGERGGMPADNPLADVDLEARHTFVTPA